MKLENIIFQNTVDLIKEAQASEHQKSIRVFAKSKISTHVWVFYLLGSAVAENSPISAQYQ